MYLRTLPPRAVIHGSTSHSLLKHVALSPASAHFTFTTTRCTINFNTHSSEVELYT
jgi:hypothetical protein